ncbi:MAG TPA: sulfite oxidase [Methylomirabilota bacterium]|nr:sulfite oxidase [Methylomirabilota bacterium]
MSKRQDGALTRRGFLIATGVAALGAGLRGGASAQPPPAPIAGKEKLIVRSGRPVNLEARLADLKDYYTPEELFYVRNNYDAAPIDPAQWSLKIEGEVGNPVVLGLADLRKLPMLTQDVTLECAGNGRSFHRPRASGIQWEHGAVGNAAWKGVRLADVLALATPTASAQHVAFDGADTPPTPQAPDFIRSVPMWKALERHTMIALEMGGKPIPHLHGGPARVVVPGFVGSASIKWLERIMLLTEEFNGFYMKSNYTAPRADNDKEIYSLQSLEVKSVIVGPADGARLPAGRTPVWGWAWSGEGELTGLDVSTDGGQTWTPGKFTGPWGRYSWRKWEHEWDAKAGTHTVMARATDSLGRVQPTTRAFNRLGYRWNVIHAVKVDVA